MTDNPNPPVEAKSPFVSKTVIFNGMQAIVAFSTLVFGHDLGLTPDVQNAIYAGIVAISGPVNIVLRMVTKGPVKFGSGS